MPDERLPGALELFARFVGAVTAVGGIALLPSAPIFGAPLVVVGVLLAARPALAGELLHAVASLA